MTCELKDRLAGSGVIPVIAINDAEKALPLAKALVAGGIPCAEVTFRTAEGEDAIRRITESGLDILVGAGTILTPQQADRAKAAGAQFAVSPGFNPKVVDQCLDIGLPIVPGCVTPSEMEQAIERGLDVVKFFPAQQAGGVDFIKAVAAPYPMLQFIPTGGISSANLVEYLSFGKILACGGSWMVKTELINGGRFDEIERLSAEAAVVVKKARMVDK